MASELASTLERLGAVKDVLTVKRVFGEPYTTGDVTVIQRYSPTGTSCFFLNPNTSV